MPAWKPEFSSTSITLASRTTWRVMVDCVFRRVSVTARNSSGMARTRITPDWRLITTLLVLLTFSVLSAGVCPSTSAVMLASISFQKSDSLRVSTAVPVVLLVWVCSSCEPVSPPVVALAFCVTWPELTRVRDTPMRCRSR